MNIAVICFSKAGEQTANRLKEALEDQHTVQVDGKSRSIPASTEESLADWTARQFREAEGILFVGSCGIAVRAIAPFVKDKQRDPAVVVVDEQGTFAIPILSGHLGGANDLAREIGRRTGAVPVVTTATDLQNLLAPDVFAKRNDCVIHNIKAAAKVAADLVDGSPVHLYTDMHLAQSPPEHVILHRMSEYHPEEAHPAFPRMVVSPYTAHRPLDPDTLWLIPRIHFIGIGCRRGTEAQKIGEAVRGALQELGIDGRSLAKAGSIDLKADEPGLIGLCADAGLELEFFTEDQLMEAKGNFTRSDFVQKVTGVESVCERSAVAASGYEGSLIFKKRVYDRVTVAIARNERKLTFE